MTYESLQNLINKTGTGKIDPVLIKKAQQVMERNNVDFVPMGRVFIDNLGKLLEDIENLNTLSEEMRFQVTKCVMELKANSKMFGFDLVGDMSVMLLNLIEKSEKVDVHLISLLDVYHKSCKAMIGTNMSGSGGAIGEEILEEFTAACDRYKERGFSRA